MTQPNFIKLEKKQRTRTNPARKKRIEKAVHTKLKLKIHNQIKTKVKDAEKPSLI